MCYVELVLFLEMAMLLLMAFALKLLKYKLMSLFNVYMFAYVKNMLIQTKDDSSITHTHTHTHTNYI